MEKCDDEETITDDIFKAPSSPSLNNIVTITSESNTAQRRSSNRFGTVIYWVGRPLVLKVL